MTNIQRRNQVTTIENAKAYAAAEEKYTFCADLLECSVDCDKLINKLEDNFDDMDLTLGLIEKFGAANITGVEDYEGVKALLASGKYMAVKHGDLTSLIEVSPSYAKKG